MPKPNGTVKLIVGILAFATICVSWGIAWASINKDVKENAKDIAAKVETAVYKSDMRRIDERLKTLIDGQDKLMDRINDKHN